MTNTLRANLEFKLAVIILESIGFSATHSISDMLSMDGTNYVCHGSQNFKKRTNIGIENLSFPAFFKEMQELEDEYENCISVHSAFLPAEIAKTIQGTDAKFFALTRKSQKEQILSCFFWAVNGFLNGRQDMNDAVTRMHSNLGRQLNEQGLISNFQTCLMVFAMRRVLIANVKLGLNAQRVFFMEDVIQDPNSFAIELGLIKEKDPSLKVHKKASHREKVAGLEFLSDVNGTLDALAKIISVKILEQNYSIDEAEKLLNQKASIDANTAPYMGHVSSSLAVNQIPAAKVV